MRRLTLLAPLLLLAGAACGGSGGGTTTPVQATVHDIQTGTVTAGRQVILADVVVMAISATGDRVWVSDALAASARSGVEVYRGSNPGALSAGVGDHIRVEGTVQEFGQGAGGTVTQVASPTIVGVSLATGAPAPVSGVDLAAITLNTGGEDYEGVLVQLVNVKVAGTAPYTFTDGTTTFGAGQQVISLSDAVGTCYATLTGIWNYDVVADAWIIVPVPGGLVPGNSCS